MPRTRECDFCGDEIEPGTGTMFVHVDGTTVHYCSSKCEKNADLGREPRDVEWTEEGRPAVAAEPEAPEGGEAGEEPDEKADEPEPGAEEGGTVEGDGEPGPGEETGADERDEQEQEQEQGEGDEEEEAEA